MPPAIFDTPIESWRPYKIEASRSPFDCVSLYKSSALCACICHSRARQILTGAPGHHYSTLLMTRVKSVMLMQ